MLLLRAIDDSNDIRKKKKNVSTARYSYHSNSLPVWPSRSKLDLNLPRILRRILNLASKCTRPVHACLPARRVGTRAFARAPNSPVSKTKLASGFNNNNSTAVSGYGSLGKTKSGTFYLIIL